MGVVKSAADLIPWKVTDISLRPHKGMWSMNPSIHFDGDLWRCSLRCADYCMLDGETVRSSRAKRGETLTKNAMVIFDPDRWKPVEIYKMRERDGLPRASCGSVGYEDLRIFRTDRHGLQGIAASLHLRRDGRSQLAEQVLLSFDAEYNMILAQPIRGDWGILPQKNWVPFDHCAEPRFLYSISKGTMSSERGLLSADEAIVRRSTRGHVPAVEPGQRAKARARERAHENDRALREVRKERKKRERGEELARGIEPSSSHEALRGGTQLVWIGDDSWLGIGHMMNLVRGLKYYWHVWYVVDSRGKMKLASPMMKLAPHGIEFAAGMAIDGDRVVVSFGVDDMECRIGETSLSAVMGMLQKVES